MKTISAIMVAALVCFSAVFSSMGQSAGNQVTPEQLIVRGRTIGKIVFSPDGQKIVMVVQEPRAGQAAPIAHLWEYKMDTHQLAQLTSSAKSETNPSWSPDGSTLAYVSNIAPPAQIYLLPVGGEATRLTDGKRAIGQFEWSPDGKKIAFLSPDRSPNGNKPESDDPTVMVVDAKRTDPIRTRNLWIIDVSTKEAKQLTTGPWNVSELGWLPDGTSLLLTARDFSKSSEEKAALYSISVGDGKIKEIAKPKTGFANVEVSPDGKQVSYIGERIEGLGQHDLFVQAVDGGPARNLTEENLDRRVRNSYWQPDRSIIATVESGFGTAFYRIRPDGKCERMPVDLNPISFDCWKGKIAFASSPSPTSFEELWVVDGPGAPQKISSLNGAPVSLIPLETFRFKSFDGTEIEGALVKPATYHPGNKVPLIVLVHGGPVSRWGLETVRESWGQLLASRGYAVLYLNVRGSEGYGIKFSRMSEGDLGGGDFKDIMAGVDYLIAKGIADPDRLGIGGWSYGGEMSAWAITQTQRFKAAVVGAPVVDQVSEIGTEDDPSGDIQFFGNPYEHLDLLHRISPITYAKNIKTPTLLLHGTEDTNNPIGQSKEFFAALKYYGVESEFVIYPREQHGFREEKHLIDRLNRILRWYDTHLK